MARSPEALFGEAQAAKARGDLATFFRCLDRKDQLRLGTSAMLGLLGEEPRVVAVFSTLRNQHGIPSVAADELRSLTRELTASAQRIPSLQGVARESASSDHALLVKRYERAVKGLLESVSDLPKLLGDVEPAFRQLFGGGLVSSSLLVGDSLEQVAVQGNRAWGTRVGTTSTGSRWTEDIGFARDRSGEWRIRLLAKRPRSLEQKG